MLAQTIERNSYFSASLLEHACKTYAPGRKKKRNGRDSDYL